MSEIPITSRSGHLPRRNAAKMPRLMPTLIHRTNAPTASQNVTGAALTMRSSTSAFRW